MKKIKITDDRFALVDNEDYDRLSHLKWFLQANGAKTNFYPAARFKSKTVLMHRLILDALPGFQVDHKNGNPFDNRRANLRIATAQLNNCNRKPDLASTSKYKGVSWHKRSNNWRAQIQFSGKKHSIGYFENELEAAQAYDRAAIQYHGSFARLNGVL